MLKSFMTQILMFLILIEGKPAHAFKKECLMNTLEGLFSRKPPTLLSSPPTEEDAQTLRNQFKAFLQGPDDHLFTYSVGRKKYHLVLYTRGGPRILKLFDEHFEARGSQVFQIWDEISFQHEVKGKKKLVAMNLTSEGYVLKTSFGDTLANKPITEILQMNPENLDEVQVIKIEGHPLGVAYQNDGSILLYTHPGEGLKIPVSEEGLVRRIVIKEPAFSGDPVPFVRVQARVVNLKSQVLVNGKSVIIYAENEEFRPMDGIRQSILDPIKRDHYLRDFTRNHSSLVIADALNPELVYQKIPLNQSTQKIEFIKDQGKVSAIQVTGMIGNYMDRGKFNTEILKLNGSEFQPIKK